ncbi:MAG: hypothetical protein EAZ55_00575 [Cytophagales bacterium]|nr:MAG: hypothetical protein EAZ55_00575 [Cytophagales bacterium]
MKVFAKPLFIHWFYYISAIISYLIAFLLLAIHYYQQNLTPSFSCYVLMITCFVYPHITFWLQYWKTGFSEAHERYCMLFDVSLSGIFANFIAIYSTPALLFFTLTLTNLMLSHGVKYFFLGLLFSIVNLSVILLWEEFRFFAEISVSLATGSGVLMFVYPVYLASLVHFQTQDLKNSRATLKMQKAAVQELNEELNQLNEELATTVDTISAQKNEIERQNEDVKQSINYAKRIQEAAMHPLYKIEGLLNDFFILHKPKDIVSGDFYYMKLQHGKIYIAAVDCTGHGIPGAFMSLLGNDMLTEVINSMPEANAGEILQAMDKGIIRLLKQSENQNKDGMDMTLLILEEASKKVHFAGAKNPLVYVQHHELKTIKGDNRNIGGLHQEPKDFLNHVISFEANEEVLFYLFSDGFQDQFGGPKKRRFYISHFKTLLHTIYHLPLTAQQQQLENTIEAWRAEGKEFQTDDILVIGLKVSF